MEKPIFILGIHKSGTSLIRNLLDGHPDLFVIPIETHLFQWNGYPIQYPFRHFIPQKKISNDDIIKNYYQHIKDCNRIYSPYTDHQTQGKWDESLFLEDLKKYGDYSDISLSAEHYFQAIHKNLFGTPITKSKRIVEKSVEHLEYALLLKKIFPDAKFIHIVRNPYSNLISMRKYEMSYKKFYPFLKKSIDSLFYNFYYLLKNKEILGNSYHVLTYEDLLSRPSKIMHQIADFLEISFHEKLLYPTQLDSPWHGNSMYNEKFTGISAKNLFRWKKEIENIEIALINKKFNYFLQLFDYEVLPQRNSSIPAKNELPHVYLLNRFLLKFSYYF